ncbi:hypothetical protein SDC9_86750 [bioreactor metagenome]|uniref:Uncharacterized protein n=1 Tax=bioreactor metagenome TaxID=1076179 RepID=A0A644ZGT8_9ZZZZ
MPPNQRRDIFDPFVIIGKFGQKALGKPAADPVMVIGGNFPVPVSCGIGFADIMQEGRPHKNGGIAAFVFPFCRLVHHQKGMVPYVPFGMVLP